MLSQTLCPQGLGGSASIHESPQHLMRAFAQFRLFYLLSGARAGKVGKTPHCKGAQEHRGLPCDSSPSRSRPGFLAGWDLSDHDSSEFWEERSSYSAKPQPPQDAQLMAEPRRFWMSASLRTDSSNVLHFDGLSLSPLWPAPDNREIKTKGPNLVGLGKGKKRCQEKRTELVS